jgi:hypothetical protein
MATDRSRNVTRRNTPEAFDRLPKWAQQRIELLERELADREARLIDPLRGGSATAFLRDLAPDGAAIWTLVPLRDDRVVFKVGAAEFEAHVVEHQKVPVLEVRVSGRMSERIDVMPQSSNSIALRGRSYFEDVYCAERRGCAMGRAHDGPCRNRHGEVLSYPPDDLEGD